MKNQFFAFFFVSTCITLLCSCKEPKGHCDAYSCNDKESTIHSNKDLEKVTIKKTTSDDVQ